MSRRRLWTKFRELFLHGRIERELDEEIRAHLELEEEDQRDAGLSGDDARYAARRAFGNITMTREESREMWIFRSFEIFLQDIRYGLRMLAKNPGFTVVAVLTLALGIGANTAIFSVVNAVLLRPLSFRDPGNLVALWQTVPKRAIAQGQVSPANFLDWRDGNPDFEDLVALAYWNFDYTGKGEPESFTGELVTGDFFKLLGTSALHGRTFSSEEYEPGRDHVVMLSHGLWQRRFGSDPGIVGQAISLSDETYTVVGILPTDFSLPWLGREREVFAPNVFSPEEKRLRGATYLQVLGRLKPHRSIGEVRTKLAATASRLAREYPAEDGGMEISVVPLDEQVVGKIRPMLFVLLGAVGFVLLIGCANVANLLLARGSKRQRELAIRVSLGADRRRLVRQLLTESLLLGVLGCAGGLLLARWTTRLVLNSNTANIPRLEQTTMDWRVLAFGAILGVLTSLVFGLAPALQLARTDLHGALKEGSDRTTASSVRHRLRGAFVVSEVALALMLLTGAGLFLRSFVNLLRVNSGYAADRVLALQVFVWNRYTKPEARAAFFQDALQKVAALPGVEAAGAASSLPLLLGGPKGSAHFAIEGQPPLRRDHQPTAVQTLATPDYFTAMGIPLVRGRLFNAFDKADSLPVVLINQTLAQRYWSAEDPIGKKIKVLPVATNGAAQVSCEVIGIVGDIRQQGPERQSLPEFFRPHPQDPTGSMAFVVRTSTDPAAMLKSIESAIWEANDKVTFYDVQTMRRLQDSSLADRRLNLILFASFASLALILAAIGIYGVVSYSTSQRTQEIGIRMALGAQRQHVIGLVVAQGMRVVLIGLGIGVGVALALTRLLASLLFGVSATDPWTFAGVTSLLVVVAFLACYIPARRATRVDPIVALRYE